MPNKRGRPPSQSKQGQAGQPAQPQDTLPASVEAEKAVLGAMFLWPDAYYEAGAIGLKLEDFHMDSHRLIYQCIADLIDAEVPVDMIAASNYLEGQGWLQKIGDVGYISSLIDGVPDRPSIKHHVEILKEHTMRRKLQLLGMRAQQQAQDMSEPPKWALSGIQEDALAILGDAEEKRVYRAGELAENVLAEIRDLRQYHPDHPIGLPTFIRELDEITTGIRKDELWILGGFPGSAKSALMMNIASRNAELGTAVLIFSVEMIRNQLYERLLSSHSTVIYRSIRRPTQLVSSEMRALEEMAAMMKEWPLFIDDQARHISEIVARSQLYVKKHKVALIMVDFIQIVEAPGDKEYDRVSYVADALRDLAKRTHIPILALSQLSRPDSKTGSKGAVNVKPNMMMLRSSGKLEQNAHVVIFTFHPMDEEKDTPTGEDLILVGKQRAGARGRARTFFNGDHQRWEEVGVEPASTPKQLSMPEHYAEE